MTRKNELKERRMRRMREDVIAEEVEEWDLFEAWRPLLVRLGRPGEVTAQEVVDKLGPLGVMVLAKLMVGAESEHVQYCSAREIAYMHGMKPVERSQSLNVNIMAEAEIDALLRSKLYEFGMLRDDGGGVREIGVGAEADVVTVISGEGEDGEEEKG